MQPRFALLLAIFVLPATAADLSRGVPDRFIGNWCTQPPPGEEDTGESDIRISADEIGYYRNTGKILSAAALGDQLTMIVELQEEGRSWLSTHDFELSGNGDQLITLREDGKIRTRVRCPESSEPPPNNSFKPSPLRGLGRNRAASGGPA